MLRKFLCNLWGQRLEGWSNTAARLAGWRSVTRQVWICLWWTGLFCTVPVVLKTAAHLRADGISCCCYIVNVHNHPSWARKAWPGNLVDPCLLSGCNPFLQSGQVTCGIQIYVFDVILYVILSKDVEQFSSSNILQSGRIWSSSESDIWENCYFRLPLYVVPVYKNAASLQSWNSQYWIHGAGILRKLASDEIP